MMKRGREGTMRAWREMVVPGEEGGGDDDEALWRSWSRLVENHWLKMRE